MGEGSMLTSGEIGWDGDVGVCDDTRGCVDEPAISLGTGSRSPGLGVSTPPYQVVNLKAFPGVSEMQMFEPVHVFQALVLSWQFLCLAHLGLDFVSVVLQEKAMLNQEVTLPLPLFPHCSSGGVCL